MSTRRGYLETQGDRKRLRIVKEGYDADDPNVPANAVLFDSESDGMGSVLETGEHQLSGSPGSLVITGRWIRSWDYPFVPLCIFSFRHFYGWVNSIDSRILAGADALPNPVVRVSKSGIWLRGSFASTGAPLAVRWTAFRIAAT